MQTSANKVRFEYIDFLKGIAIAYVLLSHALSGVYTFHFLQGVPVFLAITFFLTFRNIEHNACSPLLSWYYSRTRITKTFIHVIVPWLITICLQFAIVIIYSWITKDYTKINEFLKIPLGFGPGAYYIYIYIWFWLLMPFIYMLLTISKRYKYLGMILLSIIVLLTNILCYNISIPSNIYSVLFFRHLFLAVIGYAWLKYDIKIKWLFLLSLISLVYWFLPNCNFGGLVYKGNWSTHNWPSYFYTLLYINVLIYIYNKIKGGRIASFISWMGKESWYIFLIQMFMLWIGNYGVFTTICSSVNITSVVFTRILYIVYVFGVSIGPIYLFRLYQKRR